MKVSDISSSFKLIDGRLYASGVDVNAIVEQEGTPLFIYDAETIKNRYNYLRGNLPKEIDIFYAMKANSNIAVIKQLVALGAGVEVASEGELYACQKVGVDPKNIIFAGPAKTDEDISMAIDMGIYALNAESLGEIKRINRIAAEKKCIMDVELRINPEFEIAGVAVSLGGGSKKFGIDSEQVDSVIEEVKDMNNVRLQGIHLFAGTGINNTEGFFSNFENCINIARDLNDRHFKVLSVDIGGGIGIPYSDSDEELNIEGVSQRISKMIDDNPFIRENGTRIIAEPGRFLVGQSGIYITRVVDRKNSRGREYLLVDGGAQHLLRPALLEQTQPTYNLSRLQPGENEASPTEKFDVGGSLCTSIDFLGKGIELPGNSSTGDLIGVFCSGAYGYNESMPFFLSHDIAGEVLVYKGKHHIIRPRIEIKSFVDIQSIPEDLV